MAFFAAGPIVIGAALVLFDAELTAHGAVAVLRNATSATIQVAAQSSSTARRSTLSARTPASSPLTTIEPGDSRPLFFSGELRIRFAQETSSSLRPVRAFGVYDVVRAGAAGPLRLNEIPLIPDQLALPVNEDEEAPRLVLAGSQTISVKIFVDDDEMRRRTAWEPVLRQRIADASDVLQAHAGVELRVVDIGTWDSDDAERDFGRSLTEFEQEASLGDAHVAIGFTSQYQVVQGRYHMGGTRGPLHSHVLLKERARGIQESERLELLIHEVGHYLGASHSAEPTSVMRPLLDRGRLRQVGNRVRFDPANTLLIAMMGEEIRFRRARQMTEVSPSARRRMMAVCAALAPQLPHDPAAARIHTLNSQANASQIVDDTRRVLEAIVEAGELEAARLKGPGVALAAQRDGDELLELYVRRAAAAARSVEGETSRHALLLALGIALDDGDLLRNNFVTRELTQRVEDEGARRRRKSALGTPTMEGRADWAKHFFVSAHATALMGGSAAEAAGLFKETQDAHGGSGFSFADLQADLAGIAFAEALLNGKLALDDVEKSFAVKDFLPPCAGLPEGTSSAALLEEFGGLAGERTQTMLREMRRAIRSLPPYRQAEVKR